VPWNLQFKFEDEKKLSEITSEKSEKDDRSSVAGDEIQKDEKEKTETVKEKEEDKKSEKDEEEIEDYQVNEGKKTVVYKRYYHMFKHGELEELIKEIPEVEIEESFYDHANWCVRLERKS